MKKRTILFVFIGLFVSSSIYALTCKERSESKWYEHCQNHCSYHLGKDDCSQGTPFTNCLDECISDCDHFGRYEGVYCKGN